MFCGSTAGVVLVLRFIHCPFLKAPAVFCKGLYLTVYITKKNIYIFSHFSHSSYICNLMAQR